MFCFLFFSGLEPDIAGSPVLCIGALIKVRMVFVGW